jgi:hypothetical protein
LDVALPFCGVVWVVSAWYSRQTSHSIWFLFSNNGGHAREIHLLPNSSKMLKFWTYEIHSFNPTFSSSQMILLVRIQLPITSYGLTAWYPEVWRWWTMQEWMANLGSYLDTHHPFCLPYYGILGCKFDISPEDVLMLVSGNLVIRAMMPNWEYWRNCKCQFCGITVAGFKFLHLLGEHAHISATTCALDQWRRQTSTTDRNFWKLRHGRVPT